MPIGSKEEDESGYSLLDYDTEGSLVVAPADLAVRVNPQTSRS